MSIAAKIWSRTFERRLGIRMPEWMIQKAEAISSDDLTNILTEFSSLCPVAMTGLDRSFLEEIQAYFTKLKVDAAERDAPILTRQNGGVLRLDDRVKLDGNAADVCFNPVVMSDLYNAVVVFVDAGVSTSFTIQTLEAIVASKTKLFVIAPFDSDALRTAIGESAINSTNLSGSFGQSASGKEFTEMFPKIASHFVCLTTWSRVAQDAFPDAGTRFIHRNIMIIERGEDDTERTLPHLRTGYGRVLVAGDISDRTTADIVPSVLKQDQRFASVYSLPTDSEYFADTLLRHVNSDATEQSKGMLAFNDAMFKSHSIVCRKRVDRNPWSNVALLAVETRKCTMVAMNLLRSAWSLGVDTIVVFVSDSDAIEFYKRELKRDCVSTIVVRALPTQDPFVRSNAFSMRAYNQMMTSCAFWEMVRDALPEATHVVCVQDDGTFIRKVPDNVKGEWTQYDWIGAPWASQNLPHLKSLVPDLVGNGGVSLRNIDAMLECTRSPKMDEIRRTLFNDTFDMPEDVSFCWVLQQTDKNIAPNAVANAFAMEQVVNENAYAVHKPWLYHKCEIVAGILTTANLEMGVIGTGEWKSSIPEQNL